MSMKIKRIILILLLVFLFTNIVYALERERVYQITLKYDKGTITKENLIVTMGFPEHRKIHLEDDYRLEAISFDNKILYTTYFNFPLEIFAEPLAEWFDEEGNQIYFPTEEESGHIILDEATQLLVIPYFKDGKQINIYDKDDSLVLEIDISYLAERNVEVPKIDHKAEVSKDDQNLLGITIAITILLIIIIFSYLEYRRFKYQKKSKEISGKR